MPGGTDVAVIGAGPYGLSIAAHLRGRGIKHRIVGRPMQFWRTQMPRDMKLKSEGFASDLYDPQRKFKLRDFCALLGIEYADVGVPIDNRTFCAYGLSFQRRFAPDLEEQQVVALDRTSAGFELQLDNGDSFHARRVVLAVGIGHFPYIPENIAHLPAHALSHSSEHSEFAEFRGRDVTVLGAGASAIDLAALLAEAGAEVKLIARRAELPFGGTGPWPSKRSVLGHLRRPYTGIGAGWKSRFYCDAPLGFYRLPQSVRVKIVRTHLGPSAGYFMRDRVIGRLPLFLECAVEQAVPSNGRVLLRLATPNGQREVATDHLIAATGYRVDVRALNFLSEALRAQVKSVEQTPVLSAQFESTVRGLYFVGVASANSFGPMMRFAFGAGFTSRRLCKHLAATTAAR